MLLLFCFCFCKGFNVIEDQENLKPGSGEYCQAYAELIGKHYNDIKSAVQSEMSKAEISLKGFEKVKDIFLEHEIGELLTAFTPENNLLTPSMKLKRPQLIRKYVTQIKNLYTALGEPPKEGEHWGD